MRVPRGPVQTRRHKRMRQLTKGMSKTRQARFVLAKQAMFAAWKNVYRDRKLRKRDFRSLWITRLNAACRAHGLTYSQFIASLYQADITLNRKMLSEIAIHSPITFQQILASASEGPSADAKARMSAVPSETAAVAKKPRVAKVKVKAKAE